MKIAIRHGDWKLLTDGEAPPTFELYNLAVDLGEKDNLFNVEHTKSKEMQNIFWNLHNQIEAERPKGGLGQGWHPIK